jgi:phosphatidylglycerophosphatase A
MLSSVADASDPPPIDDARPAGEAGPRSFGRLAIGSALGLGLSPILPGTCGALVGLGLHALLAALLPDLACRLALLLLTALVGVANHVLTPWAVARWKDPDPSHFVLDEVAGYTFAAALAPAGPFWPWAFVVFVLFRGLDMVKVFPASVIDRRMHGPWGILLDDLVSGAYAAGVVHVLRIWL